MAVITKQLTIGEIDLEVNFRYLSYYPGDDVNPPEDEEITIISSIDKSTGLNMAAVIGYEKIEQALWELKP